jgi:hypothetical protein
MYLYLLVALVRDGTAETRRGAAPSASGAIGSKRRKQSRKEFRENGYL